MYKCDKKFMMSLIGKYFFFLKLKTLKASKIVIGTDITIYY